MVKVYKKPMTFGFETERAHHYGCVSNKRGTPKKVRRAHNIARLQSYLPFYGQYKAVRELKIAFSFSKAKREEFHFRRGVAREIGSLFFANVFIYPFVDGAVTLKREAAQRYKEWKTSRKEKI